MRRVDVLHCRIVMRVSETFLFSALVLSLCIRVLFSGRQLTPGGVTDEPPVVVAGSHSSILTYSCLQRSLFLVQSLDGYL
jgi:hypothetical protein